MNRREVLTLGSACVTAEALGLRPARPQSKYPDRPIKLVIPFTPGGVNDAVGRLWAEKAKELLGPVFVENQGGDGGLVGSAAVARAVPDGHTILLGSAGTQVLMPLAASSSAYELVTDLQPISMLVVSALTIVIHPPLPARNLLELIGYAKANPGKLSYGSAGAGTMTHLTGELFKSLTGLGDIVHVPYKGGGQMINDVISGHVPMVMLSVTAQLLDLDRAGKVKLLAVTTPARIVAAPDIPTAVEAGVPGMIAQNFFCLFAPAGTPKAIVGQISQAVHRAMADDGFRQKLIASGFEPYPDSRSETARHFIDDERRRWVPVIKAVGLKLE